MVWSTTVPGGGFSRGLEPPWKNRNSCSIVYIVLNKLNIHYAKAFLYENNWMGAYLLRAHDEFDFKNSSWIVYVVKSPKKLNALHTRLYRSLTLIRLDTTMKVTLGLKPDKSHQTFIKSIMINESIKKKIRTCMVSRPALWPQGRPSWSPGFRDRRRRRTCRRPRRRGTRRCGRGSSGWTGRIGECASLSSQNITLTQFLK